MLALSKKYFVSNFFSKKKSKFPFRSWDPTIRMFRTLSPRRILPISATHPLRPGVTVFNNTNFGALLYLCTKFLKPPLNNGNFCPYYTVCMFVCPKGQIFGLFKLCNGPLRKFIVFIEFRVIGVFPTTKKITQTMIAREKNDETVFKFIPTYLHFGQ